MNLCAGTSCHQGRALCATPMRCSGANDETDVAIRLYTAMHAPIAQSDTGESVEPMPTAEQACGWVRLVLLAGATAAAVGFLVVMPLYLGLSQ